MAKLAMVIRSRASLVIFLGSAAFWVLYFTVPVLLLREILDATLLACAVATVILYLPATIEELAKPTFDRAGYLLTGILIAWSTVAVQRVSTIYVRTTDTIEWLVYSPLTMSVLWMVMVAAVLHILAPGVGGVRVRFQNSWRWFLAVVIMGAAIAGFMIGVGWERFFAEH